MTNYTKQIEVAVTKLIYPNARMLISVSGGPDSTCLTLILSRIKTKLKLQLNLVYFNHHLRKDVNKETLHVRKFAEYLSLPLEVIDLSVRTYAQTHKRGIEESARELRYQELIRIAKKYNCNLIATGHTADDRIETVLLNLIRGSGMKGLTGIPEERYINYTKSTFKVIDVKEIISGNSVESEKIKLVRPLLNIFREEILGCLKENRVAYYTDPSNRDLIYLRNRIRWEIIPKLTQLNPQVKLHIYRLAELMLKEQDYWSRRVVKLIPHLVTQSGSTSAWRFNLNQWKKYHPYIRYLIIHQMLNSISIPDGIHTEKIYDLAINRPCGSRLTLPHRWTVNKIHNVREKGYVLTFTQGKVNRLNTLPRVRLKVPGITLLPDKRTVHTRIINQSLPHLRSLIKEGIKSLVRLDWDKIKTVSLYLRTRRAGDWFYFNHTGSKKKVKHYFIDVKIPQPDRHRISLVTDKSSRVYAIVGYRTDEMVKPTAATKQVLEISIYA